MASFLLPQSIQKRLLRYALSKIEILDTDSLDLKNLDIAWGSKNAFEFKSVPLRLKALTNLLHLPPEFELVKSQISLLRLTVPVDIYSSPIVVELDGVEAKLQVLADSEIEKRRKRGAAFEKEKRRKSRNAPAEDAGTGLPTAKDLAASFLETEPAEEKEELEAAILSKSQAIQYAESDTGSDDDDEIGTGASIGLPVFMANFLKGVVDRLEVRIRNVVFDMDFQVPNDNGITDPVTLQLKIDDVDIEGITYEKNDETESGLPSARRFTRKEGKRLVNLRKIRGTLISEASLFTSLAKSSSVSSPSTTHSERSKSRSSSRYTARSSRSARHASSHFGGSEEFSHPSAYRPTNPTDSLVHDEDDETPMASSVVASEGGRFDDAFDEDREDVDNLGTALDNISSVSSSILQSSRISHSSAHFGQLSQSRRFDRKFNDDFEDSDSENALAFGSQDQTADESAATPRASSRTSFQSRHEGYPSGPQNASHYSIESNPSPTRQRTRFSGERINRSGSSLSESEYDSSSSKVLADSHKSRKYEATSKDDDSSSTGSSPKQDLAQSMMFSHEEAASMYMSAMSDTPRMQRMPGGWDEEGSENLPSISPPTSPYPIQKSQIGNPVAFIATDASPTTNVKAVDTEPQASVPNPRRCSSLAPEQGFRASLPSISKVSSHISEQSNVSSEEYSRIAKCVFRLDEAAIYLPPAAPIEVPIQQTPGQFRSTTVADRSRGPRNPPRVSDMLGASSIYGTESRTYQASTSPEKPENEAKDLPELLEIFLGSVDAQFDVSVGRLITRICLVLSKCLDKSDAPPADVSKADVVPTASQNMRAKFRAEKLSLKFLDRLEGIFVGSPIEKERDMWDVSADPDVLLQTSLEGLELNAFLTGSTTKASVTLEKFLFGYATENIISFDLGLRMYDSVRDLKSSKSYDLTMDILKTPDETRVGVNTLPVCVSIDLQRLDETFSWFGGLSGVMNMGSSVASTATLTTMNPGKAFPKPRGVRFETPIKPEEEPAASRNKVDVRLGGFALQLVGQECDVALDTSAIKIACRGPNIRMSVQTMKLSGPHIHSSNDDPAIDAVFDGTSVVLLTTPEDADLDRLLALITPSNAKYDQDDDIMVDTLLRQRKKGSVLRVTVEKVRTQIGQLDDLKYLPELGNELSRLSTVAKYLPEDDRPGLLSLVSIRNVEAEVDVNPKFGKLQLSARNIEVAEITLPSLIAFSMGSVTLHRNGTEELIGPAPGPATREPELSSPAVMARLIGDEMEPVVKIKLWNLRVEYSIPTLVAFLGLSADANGEDVSAELASSIATLTGAVRQGSNPSRNSTSGGGLGSSTESSLDFGIVIRDCVIGLNPLSLPSKVLVVMTEARLSAALPKNQNLKATVELNKASLLVIDDVANIGLTKNKRRSYDNGSSQVSVLCDMGFVSVCYISSAQAILQVTSELNGEDKYIDVELRDDLLLLETCADSTKTLIAALGALSPPTPPSTAMKYRTKIEPLEDMLLSALNDDAFATANNDTFDFAEDFGIEAESDLEEGDAIDDEENLGLDFCSGYSSQGSEADYLSEPYVDHNPSVRPNPSKSSELSSCDASDWVLPESLSNREQIMTSGEPLNFEENHFETGSLYEDSSMRWNSTKNEYVRPAKSKGTKAKKNPFKLRVRDVHIIWNLFDGYDWQSTRDKISKKVQEVETRAIEKKAKRDRLSNFDQEIEDDNTVIGDMLFNSIYIGIPSNRDPRDLTAAINQDINNGATETETESVITTLTSVSQRQSLTPSVKGKRLRLKRSKHHKITFELKGVNADIVGFPPGSGETLNSVDIRVHDLDVFDHIPTSTWKKFATYMHDAGEREKDANMVHIELLNVKPVTDLAASELVIRVTILPLRLHVDQDALDFITRFFAFKDDDAVKPSAPCEEPFLQRVEINDVRLCLNYKPKRIDYAGLRSGRTTELKNVINLDETKILLKHVIVYGTSGFEKMGDILNEIWTTDVKSNQIADIIGGIGPLKSLVSVGGGVRDLVVIPMREYKKNGRLMHSIGKGVFAFAKTTGMEAIKAGAKMAIGTQTVLQGAEDFLNKQPTPQYLIPNNEESDEEEEQNKISAYAAQPLGAMQGLKGGFRSLKRDLYMARDAIIAVPSEVMESGSASGAAMAVYRRAPTVILRPFIGVTGAIGQGLLGANNSLDPLNRRRTEDQYKSG